MRRGTIEIGGRTITITAGANTITHIAHQIKEPLTVTQCVGGGDYMSRVLFGAAWSWLEFPAQMKAEYDKKLAEYVAKFPDQVTARTVLPSTAWMKAYIPDERTLTVLREARKTPEEKAAEASSSLLGTTDETSGVIIRRNASKNGLEIVFDCKPGAEVLTWLHTHGFRWAFHNKVWYAKYSEQKESEAREYLKVA